jgi:hypothetical protein
MKSSSQLSIYALLFLFPFLLGGCALVPIEQEQEVLDPVPFVEHPETTKSTRSKSPQSLKDGWNTITYTGQIVHADRRKGDFRCYEVCLCEGKEVIQKQVCAKDGSFEITCDLFGSLQESRGSMEGLIPLSPSLAKRKEWRPEPYYALVVHNQQGCNAKYILCEHPVGEKIQLIIE